MSALDQALDSNSVAMNRLWRWCEDAWRLFRKAPLRFTLIAFLPVIVEGILQLVPLAGV